MWGRAEAAAPDSRAPAPAILAGACPGRRVRAPPGVGGKGEEGEGASAVQVPPTGAGSARARPRLGAQFPGGRGRLRDRRRRGGQECECARAGANSAQESRLRGKRARRPKHHTKGAGPHSPRLRQSGARDCEGRGGI
ncbi:unnamed protein product [Rangifer tarandus platyrhynchus]|uniref:Uncharacterized protein n=1 Tax=Rangifer tarandus platyrhynchus TaxID=3082113 RepID=A0ABN8Y9A1_RANTA|nr:unnamed protein product [Rangifer tarandus platyrhynchus]